MSAEQDSRFALGVISGKIDLVLLNQAEDRRINEARFAKIETTLEDHAVALAGHKRDRAWIIGLSGAVSAVGSAVVALLGFHR